MGRIAARIVFPVLLGVSVLAGPTPSVGASLQVSVYPMPGSRFDLPTTQITFRGVPAASIGIVHVSGSVSGVHAGRIEADSDGQGGSFIPSAPFTSGETVTVVTDLNVLGGHDGTFDFAIANPGQPISAAPLPVVSPGAHGVQQFRSRPDLLPPSVSVTERDAPLSAGDIFIAPQFGPLQNGPMILDHAGRLVWFDPIPINRNILVTDFREQDLYGQPVLTWWQGTTNHGSGRGDGVILNQHYQQLATVHAGNGLQSTCTNSWSCRRGRRT